MKAQRIDTGFELRREVQAWLVVGASVLLLGLLEYVNVMVPVRRSVEWVVRPPLRLAAAAAPGLRWPYHAAVFARNGVRRVQDLEYRYNELSAQVGELEKLREENTALKALIENTDRSLSKRVVATPVLAYGNPLVAIGSEGGVQPGALVFVAQTLVGRVTEVQAQQAEVRLLSHRQSQPLLARTESGAEGLVKGTGSGVILTDVARDKTLTVGERVVTLGQPGVEQGLYVGRIVAVSEQAESAVGTATIDQLVSFYDARIVEVTR